MFVFTHRHDERCQEDPAHVPELVGPHTHHLVDAVGELVRAEDPGDGDGLEEAHPQKGHAAGGVKVHQLEQVHSSLGTGKGESVISHRTGWSVWPRVLKCL